MLLIAISQAPWPLEMATNGRAVVRATAGSRSITSLETSMQLAAVDVGHGPVHGRQDPVGTTDGPGMATSSRPAFRLSSIGRVWHDARDNRSWRDQQVGAETESAWAGAAASSIVATSPLILAMSGRPGWMTGGTSTNVRARSTFDLGEEADQLAQALTGDVGAERVLDGARQADVVEGQVGGRGGAGRRRQEAALAAHAAVVGVLLAGADERQRHRTVHRDRAGADVGRHLGLAVHVRDQLAPASTGRR